MSKVFNDNELAEFYAFGAHNQISNEYKKLIKTKT
jgi:hypothetical protein